MSINSLIVLQNKLSTGNGPASMQAIFDAVTSGSLEHIRSVFWAGLLRYHPDITVEEAGHIIDDLGLDGVSEVLDQAQSAANPDQRDLDDLGVKRNPRKARAKVRIGTGGT
jgi:hypothetical protein